MPVNCRRPKPQSTAPRARKRLPRGVPRAGFVNNDGPTRGIAESDTFFSLHFVISAHLSRRAVDQRQSAARLSMLWPVAYCLPKVPACRGLPNCCLFCTSPSALIFAVRGLLWLFPAHLCLRREAV